MTDLRRLDEVVSKPLLFVDIDGVLSLFGFGPHAVPPGTWHQVDGIAHLLSHEAAGHLLGLSELFEPIWCSGWEDRANDHLPHVLRCGPWPHLTFGPSDGHWKLAAVASYAGDRPLAWIDDDLNAAVDAWAATRAAPTLIVRTQPVTGLTAAIAAELRRWAVRGEAP